MLGVGTRGYCRPPCKAMSLCTVTLPSAQVLPLGEVIGAESLGHFSGCCCRTQDPFLKCTLPGRTTELEVGPGKKRCWLGGRQAQGLLRNVEYKYIVLVLGLTPGPFTQHFSLLSYLIARDRRWPRAWHSSRRAHVVKPDARRAGLKRPLSLLSEEGHQRAGGQTTSRGVPGPGLTASLDPCSDVTLTASHRGSFRPSSPHLHARFLLDGRTFKNVVGTLSRVFMHRYSV